MCDRCVKIPYCPDKYKIQRMFDEPVDDCIATLKFIPDWFVTRKMLEKVDNVLNTNEDIFFYNEDFGKIIFVANQRLILAVDPDKIILDNDNNFDEDDADTIIHVRLLAWRSKFKKRKVFKKKISEELMPIV